MFKRLVGAAFALFLMSTPAFSQVVVTVDDVIEWDNVVGAAEYEIQVVDGGGIPVAINSAATNDPDSDGWAEVSNDPDGVSEISLTVFLIGQPTGVYTFRIRSVDANGNAGTHDQINIQYAPPGPPAPRKKV